VSSGFPTPSARVRPGGCFDTLRLVVDEAVLAARLPVRFRAVQRCFARFITAEP
jgi:hypothetical protein